jgi:hypothetical protein
MAYAGGGSGETPRERTWIMAEYQFEREARTPYSESYVIDSDGDAAGRVDLHFTASGIAFATLCVPPDCDEDEIQDLIGEIDERLVLTTDPYRDDFVVTVWRGTQAGVFSEEDEDEDAEDEEAAANGRAPNV